MFILARGPDLYAVAAIMIFTGSLRYSLNGLSVDVSSDLILASADLSLDLFLLALLLSLLPLINLIDVVLEYLEVTKRRNQAD